MLWITSLPNEVFKSSFHQDFDTLCKVKDALFLWKIGHCVFSSLCPFLLGLLFPSLQKYYPSSSETNSKKKYSKKIIFLYLLPYYYPLTKRISHSYFSWLNVSLSLLFFGVFHLLHVYFYLIERCWLFSKNYIFWRGTHEKRLCVFCTKANLSLLWTLTFCF